MLRVVQSSKTCCTYFHSGVWLLCSFRRTFALFRFRASCSNGNLRAEISQLATTSLYDRWRMRMQLAMFQIDQSNLVFECNFLFLMICWFQNINISLGKKEPPKSSDGTTEEPPRCWHQTHLRTAEKQLKNHRNIIQHNNQHLHRVTDGKIILHHIRAS